MFKYFVLQTFRKIQKDKYYAFMNILGLAIGIAAFLYIATFTFHEISFDNFHSKADRIFRCVSHIKLRETTEDITRSELPLAETAQKELPEIEAATRLYPNYNVNTSCNDKKFIEKEIWYADPNIFDVFDFRLLEGDSKSVLSKPNSIVLTKNMALKYFNDVSPVGKTLLIDNKEPYTVTGILEKIPDNSHLQFEMLASFSTLPFSKRVDDWGNFDNTYTYIVVKKSTKSADFEKKFDQVFRKYEDQMLTKVAGMSLTDFEKSGNYFIHKLQPLQKIHLNSSFSEEIKTYGNVRFLIILGITGLLILIIACLNFINLSTSRASLRAKEIGVKKIMGSHRKVIISQIFSETFVYCLLALIFSLVVLLLALPFLNNFTETIIKPGYFLNPWALLTILVIPVLVTFLAGSYPALYITSFKPAEAIKIKQKQGQSRSFSRAGLVSFQFVVFIILVFCSIIVRKQIHFLRQQNPGFSKQNVVVVRNAFSLRDNMSSFKTELLKNPSIISASYASVIPSFNENAGNPFSRKGSDENYLMNVIKVDCDFQKTLKIQLKDGRFFSSNYQTEKGNVIINESAAKLLGWKESSEKIIHDYNNNGVDYNVIAIVKDFHMLSLRDRVKPLVLKCEPASNYMALLVQPGNATEVISSVNRLWEQFNKETPFEYAFLNEAFNAQYKSEDRLARIIGLFTTLAIAVACLGLFGLILFTAEQRKKEIGIRKVNGAKTSEIMLLLNFSYIRWIVISFIIACPIAWYAMHKWLENFAYKTELSWWVFAVAGLVALGIAMLTVSWQSWRAATRNPVESLRYE
jgi:putative ABC transport system permease protein